MTWGYLEGYWRFNYPDKQQYPVRGIDVSHHQGSIDWDQVAGQAQDCPGRVGRGQLARNRSRLALTHADHVNQVVLALAQAVGVRVLAPAEYPDAGHAHSPGLYNPLYGGEEVLVRLGLGPSRGYNGNRAPLDYLLK